MDFNKKKKKKKFDENKFRAMNEAKVLSNFFNFFFQKK
jgi:hypothetical protein